MNVKGNTMNRQPCPDALSGISTTVLALHHQAMFEVPDAADARVVCLEGAVWITLDNDTRDFVLEPCEAFTATEHRRAVVYALKPSRISVARVTSERRATTSRLPHRTSLRKPTNPALAASAIWG
jgi:Protein of unknown function (DUF2917)